MEHAASFALLLREQLGRDKKKKKRRVFCTGPVPHGTVPFGRDRSDCEEGTASPLRRSEADAKRRLGTCRWVPSLGMATVGGNLELTAELKEAPACELLGAWRRAGGAVTARKGLVQVLGGFDG